MKVLITGAGGQLGQTFVRELKKKKVSVLGLRKNDLNIADFKKVKRVIEKFKPDFVVNCAAYNNVDKTENDWRTAFLVNGIAVRNLSLAANENNCVLIHYSTDYVFDGQKNSPYTIADNPNPLNKYGESKLLSEKFVQNFSKKYYLIRVSSVFGENKKASFPLKLISWARDKKKIKIAKDQVFSPSFTEDIVKATLALIKTKQFGLYHMTNSGFCSRYEWAKYILTKLKWRGKVLPAKAEDFNLEAKRPKFSVLDNFPLENMIGYSLPSWQKATDRFIKEMGIKII